jgi:hypothetical protein
MGRVRVVVHRREIERLLKAEGQYGGVRADIERRGEAVAAKAGPGNNAEGFEGHDRYRVHVYADSIEAKLAESRDRTLTRALDAGL